MFDCALNTPIYLVNFQLKKWFLICELWSFWFLQSLQMFDWVLNIILYSVSIQLKKLFWITGFLFFLIFVGKSSVKNCKEVEETNLLFFSKCTTENDHLVYLLKVSKANYQKTPGFARKKGVESFLWRWKFPEQTTVTWQ